MWTWYLSSPGLPLWITALACSRRRGSSGMGWLVCRDLRGRTGAKCHGVGRQARQPASPMEGEVRLALTATRSLLALGPRNNLPADEPSIDGHRHHGHAMAEMEGGQRLPIVPSLLGTPRRGLSGSPSD